MLQAERHHGLKKKNYLRKDLIPFEICAIYVRYEFAKRKITCLLVYNLQRFAQLNDNSFEVKFLHFHHTNTYNENLIKYNQEPIFYGEG